MLKHLFCRSHVRAAVTNGALVVSIRGEHPRLWRADIAGLSGASLAIAEVETPGRGVQYRLLLTRSGDAPEEIGVFSSRPTAQKAFTVVSDALIKGDRVAQAQKAPWIFRFVYGIAKLVVLVLFIIMVLFIASWLYGIKHPEQMKASMQMQQRLMTGAAPAAAPAGPPQGVPLPADQLFGDAPQPGKQ